MKTLVVLIDYDNVDPALSRVGPINLSKVIVGRIHSGFLKGFDGVKIRLYGGWRSRGALSPMAQRLTPVIQAESPVILGREIDGAVKNLRVQVELAMGPIGTSVVLDETLVRGRELRKFRAKSCPWPKCSSPEESCGFLSFASIKHDDLCGVEGCSTKMGDILVRDEQKMVDTLIVVDLAHQVHVARASHVVLVSSDTDMWPGVLLATQTGCNVLQIHPRSGWKTQNHLIGTLTPAAARCYGQCSI